MNAMAVNQTTAINSAPIYQGRSSVIVVKALSLMLIHAVVTVRYNFLVLSQLIGNANWYTGNRTSTHFRS